MPHVTPSRGTTKVTGLKPLTSMTDCHKSSVMLDAILHNTSSTMENADIIISQVLKFLLFMDPESRGEMPMPFGLSERFSSACKHDMIEISTVSECEFSFNELPLPESRLQNLAIKREANI